MDTNKQGLIVMYHEIKKLYNIEHFSVRKIARHLNINFRTVQKYLDMNQEEFDNYIEQKFEKSYLLDPFRDFIVSYISKYEDAPASVIHDRLKENFTAFPRLDPKTVYNYVMRVRNEFNIPKVTTSERQYSLVPDLPPGALAQVDFGEKKLRSSNGMWVKVYFFIMLLCSSRYKFIIFRDTPFTSQSAAEAHEKAFEFFRGIPREIIYDQDTVFLSRENSGDYVMTSYFAEYKNSRPFKITFCRAADPESKGKVENAVGYVKHNFLFQRTFINLDILNQQAVSWLERTGNGMIHNTTRKVPFNEWEREKPFLFHWNPVFNNDRKTGHKVLKTNSIKYRGNNYSLPFGTYKNEDTMVYLKEVDSKLVISDAIGHTISTHVIPAGVGNNVINNNHRRNTSIRLDELRSRVSEFFVNSPNIEIFIDKINRLYPRYVRDQLNIILINAEQYGLEKSEPVLEFCVRNKLFSANDFKTILINENKDRKWIPEAPAIKPLGDSRTQLIANIRPDKADILDYEVIFNRNKLSNEPVHSSN